MSVGRLQSHNKCGIIYQVGLEGEPKQYCCVCCRGSGVGALDLHRGVDVDLARDISLSFMAPDTVEL